MDSERTNDERRVQRKNRNPQPVVVGEGHNRNHRLTEAEERSHNHRLTAAEDHTHNCLLEVAVEHSRNHPQAAVALSVSCGKHGSLVVVVGRTHSKEVVDGGPVVDIHLHHFGGDGGDDGGGNPLVLWGLGKNGK